MNDPLISPDVEQDAALEEELQEELQELTEEGAQTEAAKEPPYRVLIHNDDVTPFDFVIVILIRIFQLTPIIAEHITYLAHTKGLALVTVLPKSEAERRVGKAVMAARLEGYPLTFTLEPEE